jgi:limonene-1,2-epoxide hydrolase
LIHEVLPAGEIVRRIAADAERILTERLPRMVGQGTGARAAE